MANVKIYKLSSTRGKSDNRKSLNTLTAVRHANYFFFHA
jgi:hypothetical protein